MRESTVLRFPVLIELGVVDEIVDGVTIEAPTTAQATALRTDAVARVAVLCRKRRGTADSASSFDDRASREAAAQTAVAELGPLVNRMAEGRASAGSVLRDARRLADLAGDALAALALVQRAASKDAAEDAALPFGDDDRRAAAQLRRVVDDADGAVVDLRQLEALLANAGLCRLPYALWLEYKARSAAEAEAQRRRRRVVVAGTVAASTLLGGWLLTYVDPSRAW